MKKNINIANSITLIRILLLPPLIVSYLDGNYNFSCSLIVVMALSDFLDGRIARARGTAGTFGARLDIGADFLFVFVFQGALLFGNNWRPSILILSILSAATFLIFSPGAAAGETEKANIGRYSGGVIMVLFLFRAAGKTITGPALIWPVYMVEAALILILIISIFENTAELIKILIFRGRKT